MVIKQEPGQSAGLLLLFLWVLLYYQVNEKKLNYFHDKGLNRFIKFIFFLSAIAWGIIPLNFSYHIPFLGINWTAWRLYIVICSFPNLLALIMILRFPEAPKFLYSTGRAKESLKVLANMYASNKGK